jgi:hypothetical protein
MVKREMMKKQLIIGLNKQRLWLMEGIGWRKSWLKKY